LYHAKLPFFDFGGVGRGRGEIFSIACPVLHKELLILFIQTKNFTIKVVNFLLMLSYQHVIYLMLDRNSALFPYYVILYGAGIAQQLK
jgi:hypothetical protein